MARNGHNPTPPPIPIVTEETPDDTLLVTFLVPEHTHGLTEAKNDINNTWQVHISTYLTHNVLTKDGQEWLEMAIIRLRRLAP